MRALVTGASSGIGEAMARRLAADGVALVITARRGDALEALATTLRTTVAVDVVAADLGKPGAAAEVWRAARAGGPINVLINNAGFGYFRRFDAADADTARDQELLTLNVGSLVELCKYFVNDTEPSGQRRHILNIASIAAYQSVPRMALYAASKAMVRNFSEALHDELRGSATAVTCVCPGGTKTAFHAAAGAGDYGKIANASMMSADAVAQIALAAMWKGKRTVIPGVINKLSCFGVRLVPRFLASLTASWVLGQPRAGTLPTRALPPGGDR
ncbi:MAG TPA: SDR family oxidoreductase [Kofleriaceae bacterium]|nr:SDR family oxidoreductase [Kofleriaceae bacterium]